MISFIKKAGNVMLLTAVATSVIGATLIAPLMGIDASLNGNTAAGVGAILLSVYAVGALVVMHRFLAPRVFAE